MCQMCCDSYSLVQELTSAIGYMLAPPWLQIFSAEYDFKLVSKLVSALTGTHRMHSSVENRRKQLSTCFTGFSTPSTVSLITCSMYTYIHNSAGSSCFAVTKLKVCSYINPWAAGHYLSELPLQWREKFVNDLGCSPLRRLRLPDLWHPVRRFSMPIVLAAVSKASPAASTLDSTSSASSCVIMWLPLAPDSGSA